jgi:DNA-binding PadR family transcriptional regulator
VEVIVTNAELAILSLVVERPRHGYDIEQTIVERTMRNWTDVGFSSIYYVLDKLERAGLVSSTRQPAPGRGPSRRVYTATDAGVAALEAEAIEALSVPERPSSSFQLALSVLPRLDHDAVDAALSAHRAELETQLEALRERRAAELPFHVAAMFDLGVTQMEAELGWLHRFASELRSHRRAERTTQ